MTFLGVDWADVRKGAMGGLHVGGRVLASIFAGPAGAKLADQSEALQTRGGLLPGWAQSAESAQPVKESTVSIANPDALVVIHRSDKIDDPIRTAAQVVITGGKRFEGDGKKFTFGYENPSRVEITTRSGQKAAGTDVKQIIFLNGSETRIEGSSDMDEYDVLGRQIVGEMLGMTGETKMHDMSAVEEIADNMYIHGVDILGATPPTRRVGFVFKTTPAGRKYTALVVSKVRRGDFKTSVSNARDVGRRAVEISARIRNALRRMPTRVRGAAPKRPQRAKRLITDAQLKTLADQLEKAGKALVGRAGKLEDSVAVGDAKQKTAALALRAKMFNPKMARAKSVKAGSAAKLAQAMRPVTAASRAAVSRPLTSRALSLPTRGMSRAAVLGYWNEILGAELNEILGQITDAEQAAIEAEADKYFGSRDGSTSPTTTTSSSDYGTSYSDPYTSSYTAPSYDRFPGPEDNNYGVGPAPTEAPEPTEFQRGPDPATDRNVYNSSRMPLPGIIYYELERGLPRDKFGSWERYYGQSRALPHGGNGYYWSGTIAVEAEGWARRQLNQSGGYEDIGVPVTYLLQYPTGVQESGGGSADWGPLVGAPDDWTKGLRFDMATKQWFWFWDQAPEWATGKVIRKAQLLHQAQLDHDALLTAAKADYAWQQAQDRLDAQQAREQSRQQALVDAEAERRRIQLDVERQAFEAKQTERQGEIDAMMQQEEARWVAEQARLEQQQMAQESQFMTQQAQLDQQERQMMLDYFRQHPQEMFAQQGGGAEYDAEYAEEDPFATYYAESDEGVDWGDNGQRDGLDQGLSDASEDELFENM